MNGPRIGKAPFLKLSPEGLPAVPDLIQDDENIKRPQTKHKGRALRRALRVFAMSDVRSAYLGESTISIWRPSMRG